MDSFNYPVIAIAVFGGVFIVVGIAAPWLSWNLGFREMPIGERALSVLLGSALLALYAMYRWLI